MTKTHHESQLLAAAKSYTLEAVEAVLTDPLA